MTSYGQFCPVAKAMEVLDERWTLLVVRELLYGSTRFNEVRRGVPKMSPALLAKRLRSLERVGVVHREELDGRVSYTLTECGRELHGIVESLGVWGVRWIGDLGEQDYDPHLLFWDMKRKVVVANWPRERTTVLFELADVAPKVSRWWIVVNGQDVDICDVDPGHEPVATVRTTLHELTAVWRGDIAWERVLVHAEVMAPTDVVRQLPAWMGQSELAGVPRPAVA